MMLQRRLLSAGPLLALSLCAPRASAQSYEVSWWKVAGGGGTSAGGAYSLTGAAGQPDASGELTGGSYTLVGGFFPPDTLQADVSVTVSAAPSPAYVGQNLVYTITVGNDGPGSAAGVVLTDTLASGLPFGSAPGCSLSGMTLTCAIGTLASGSSSTITVTVTPTAVGSVSNAASVTSAGMDPNPGNNSASVTTTVTSLPTLSINDVTVAEGNSGTTAVVFTVALSQASSLTVTVNYATADGTANAGSDYTTAQGILTISGGSSGTFTIDVTGDTAPEPDETLSVVLSAPVNATLAKATGQATIADDDSPSALPRVSIEDRTVAEGAAANAALRLVLSAPSNDTVTVRFDTADGTATAGADYTAASGTVSFTAGRTTQTVIVPIVTDTASEGAETFLLNLSQPVGALLGDGQAVVTIEDPPAAAKVPMYRAYNRRTDYHFFTTDRASKDFAVGVLGFQDESDPIPFHVWNVRQTDSVPLFRMYNPNLGRHFYTAGVPDREFLMSIGMTYEKDEGFIFLTEVPSTTVLYKLYNKNSGTHLFTADAAQKSGILALFPAWEEHSPVGYVFSSP